MEKRINTKKGITKKTSEAAMLEGLDANRF
jgi:hypothetical protein